MHRGIWHRHVRVCGWRPRRRAVWSVRAANVGDAGPCNTDLVDLIVRCHDELDERAGRPLIVAEELRQLDAPCASRLVVPALLGATDVPPPDEGVVALDDPLKD